MALPTENPHSRRKPGSTYPATEPLKSGSRLSPGMRVFRKMFLRGRATQRGMTKVRRRRNALRFSALRRRAGQNVGRRSEAYSARLQSIRRTRFSSTVSLVSSASYLIGHLPADAFPVTFEGYQPPSLNATITLSPLLHLATGLPGPSIDQARASSSPKVISSSAPPSIRAMHRSPDLEASRAVTDHHASSCMTKKRAPGAQPALPPVLAEAFVSGFAGAACGFVPA